MKTEKRFLVALSFAGENRRFIEKVANVLSKHLGSDKVFYDNYYKSELARPNLDTYLQDIYHEQSKLVAVFLCDNYEKKEWCGLEWRAIRDIIKNKKDDDIMPFKFNKVEVKGLFSIDGYIDVNGHEPEQIAEYILTRLDVNHIETIAPKSAERDIIEIVLNEKIDHFSDERLRNFANAITELLKDNDVKIVGKRMGSVIITLEIAKAKWPLLLNAIKEGKLDNYHPKQLKVNGSIKFTISELQEIVTAYDGDHENNLLKTPFQKLNIIEPILRVLKTEGYIKPTPLQEKAIPIVLNRHDLLGCAPTGTGKTAAFAIPIIQILTGEQAGKKYLLEQRDQTVPRPIYSLILTPTRELAVQIGESFTVYGKNCNLKHLVIFGGVSQHSQIEALKRGVDIIIATPGRLLDLMSQRFIHLNQVKIFVLDEADRMLDMGFINDVQKVISKLPTKRQTLLFSATMPPTISRLADSILFEPMRVEITAPASIVGKIKQELYYVSKNNKCALLLHLLKDETLARVLVFTRTKHGADKVTRDLQKINIKAAAIHGNKSQNARQNALNNFKRGDLRVLVATDIAARGIYLENLSHVINYELPNVPQTYVHRMGKIALAELSRSVISFCDVDEKTYLKDIQKEIGKQILVIPEHPYSMSSDTPSVPTVSKPDKKTHHHHSKSDSLKFSNKWHLGGGKNKA